MVGERDASRMENRHRRSWLIDLKVGNKMMNARNHLHPCVVS